MAGETERLKRIRQWVEEKKEERKREPVAPRHSEANPDAIAITGLSGYFPGCMDVAHFFRCIDRDESLIGEIDEARLALIAGNNDAWQVIGPVSVAYTKVPDLP